VSTASSPTPGRHRLVGLLAARLRFDDADARAKLDALFGKPKD